MTDELTTTQDCAARWGVSDSYARQILASLDHVDRDPVTGAKRYERVAADAARSSRPGRGRRVDLHTPAVVGHETFLRLAADESLPAPHRALWALMQSGMSVGDALSLDVRDVDLDEGRAHVELPVKGPKPQTISLSDRAVELAREVMAQRDEGPLLADKQGRPVSRYSAIKFAKIAAGVPIHAFKTPPHTLESPWEYVQAKDLHVGDTVRLDDFTGVVDRPLVIVQDSSGARTVEVTFRDTSGPVSWDADLWVAIGKLQETPES